MSFLHSCSFVLTLDAEIHASSVARMLRSLGPMFVPCKLSYAIGADETTRVTSINQRGQLWNGEICSDGPMTLYEPSPEHPILSGFERAASGRAETAIWLSTIGALRHCAPGTESPHWYGRWNTSDGGLYELMQLRVSTVSGEPHEVEAVFPLMGYPLTSSVLQHDRVIDGEPRTAAQNREAMLPLIAGIRDALGVPAERATWSIDGQFRSDYPDDFSQIKTAMSRLAVV